MEEGILVDVLKEQKAEVLELVLTTFNRELYEQGLIDDAKKEANREIEDLKMQLQDKDRQLQYTEKQLEDKDKQLAELRSQIVKLTNK